MKYHYYCNHFNKIASNNHFHPSTNLFLNINIKAKGSIYYRHLINQSISLGMFFSKNSLILHIRLGNYKYH